MAEGILKKEEMGDNKGEVEKMADEGESGELEEEGVLKREEMGNNLEKVEKVVCKGGKDETKNAVGDS